MLTYGSTLRAVLGTGGASQRASRPMHPCFTALGALARPDRVFESLREALGGVFESLREALGGVFDPCLSALGAFARSDGVFESLREALGGVFESLREALGGVFLGYVRARGCCAGVGFWAVFEN